MTDESEKIVAETVNIKDGGAGMISGQTVTVKDGGAAIITGEQVSLHDAGGLVVVGRSISIKDGGALAMVAEDAEVTDGTVGLLITGNLGGNAKVIVDAKAALIIGVVVAVALTVAQVLFGRELER